jgi:peptidoglycan/LPS O-acetylase OafA/YrhL
MRCIFMLAVLATHVTSKFTNAFVSGSHSHAILLASHMMLHFTRMGFMFITGLVLFLVYYHRSELHVWKFWGKHFKNIGIPYLFWMGALLLMTMLLAPAPFSGSKWLLAWWHGIIHGNRFYLYYLYVTMQFYIFFPALIWLFKKTEGHHNWVLAISAIIQFGFLVYIKYLFPHLSHANWPYLLVHYGDCVFTYQYYFVLGGYVWIHYDQIKKWVRQHHWGIYFTAATLALGTLALYLFNTRIMKMPRHYANIAHQPYIMIYATAMIFAVIALSLKYAEMRERPGWQWFSKAVGITSTLSFGVYLVQTIPIRILIKILRPLAVTITSWQLLILMPVGLCFVFAICWLISYFCYKVPPLGILIGRSNWQQFKQLFHKDDDQKLAPENK